ncbi:MAG TPA: ABC transporter permease [Vicinamibacterales bacterium]|nr:ABC transporter permease [Vicinamibacterales bacterium]
MRFELFIALRYLLARRKQAFISVISLISTVGVGVGVIALIVALALMTGLQGELRDRILGSTAHVYVWKTGGITDYQAEVQQLRKAAHVVGAAPAIMGKALVSSPQGKNFITLKGIDPTLEPNVTDLGKTMQQGSVDAVLSGEDELPGILIGKQLAQTLGVKVGDVVNLLTDQGTLSPGGMLPRNRKARVGGIFSMGLLEFDSEWGFVSLDFAERLVGVDQVELIQLRVDDVDAAPAIAQNIEASNSSYRAQDWTDLNASFFSALSLEKLGMSIAIGLIMMVAALQIVASLILLVMEKSRDIGILKTMGTSPRRISVIFMMQGTIIGVVGTVIGAIAAVALCWVLTEYKLVHIPEDVYQVSYVPFIVTPADFLLVVVSAIVICFLATIYPSRQAAHLDPVQALRFE